MTLHPYNAGAERCTAPKLRFTRMTRKLVATLAFPVPNQEGGVFEYSPSKDLPTFVHTLFKQCQLHRTRKSVYFVHPYDIYAYTIYQTIVANAARRKLFECSHKECFLSVRTRSAVQYYV